MVLPSARCGVQMLSAVWIYQLLIQNHLYVICLHVHFPQNLHFVYEKSIWPPWCCHLLDVVYKCRLPSEYINYWSKIVYMYVFTYIFPKFTLCLWEINMAAMVLPSAGCGVQMSSAGQPHFRNHSQALLANGKTSNTKHGCKYGCRCKWAGGIGMMMKRWEDKQERGTMCTRQLCKQPTVHAKESK